MATKRPLVKEAESGTCPLCGKELAPTDGTSVMRGDGLCIIVCPFCNGEYAYRRGA